MGTQRRHQLSWKWRSGLKKKIFGTSLKRCRVIREWGGGKGLDYIAIQGSDLNLHPEILDFDQVSQGLISLILSLI